MPDSLEFNKTVRLMRDPQTLEGIADAIKGLVIMLRAMAKQPEIQEFFPTRDYSQEDLNKLIDAVRQLARSFSKTGISDLPPP